MKRSCVLLILAGLILVACAGLGTNSAAAQVSEAQALATKYKTAYETKDADMYLSLFNDDSVFTDYGMKDGPISMSSLKSDVYDVFKEEAFSFKVKSHFVSSDGQYASVRGDFSYHGNTGSIVTVPATTILEFKSGKIVSETWYYDGTNF
jgi:ketosteroid isomerase-like protein